jgi:hypothetical protein
MSVQTNGRRITRDDLEAAFQKVVGESTETVARTIPQALVVAGAAALAVVAVAFLAGKRRGANKSSVIEIRRL